MFGQPIQFNQGAPLLKPLGMGLRPPQMGVSSGSPPGAPPTLTPAPTLTTTQQPQSQQQQPPNQQQQPPNQQPQPQLVSMGPSSLGRMSNQPVGRLQPQQQPGSLLSQPMSLRTTGVPVIRPVGLQPAPMRPMQGLRPPMQANLTIGQPAAGKTAEDPQLAALKQLRRTSGLKHIPVASSLMAFKNAAVNQELGKDIFLKTYQKLLKDANLEIPDLDTQMKVFGLFDKDNNDIVDMMELVCGISLLCQGTEEEKIAAVFNVFDENGDGFISMDEMFKFLTSVFRVVLTPNVMATMKQMGVEVESADDLASVTSLECFKVADLNNDGKLSREEFKNWFYAPKNDPTFMFSPMRKLLL